MANETQVFTDDVLDAAWDVGEELAERWGGELDWIGAEDGFEVERSDGYTVVEFTTYIRDGKEIPGARVSNGGSYRGGRSGHYCKETRKALERAGIGAR